MDFHSLTDLNSAIRLVTHSEIQRPKVIKMVILKAIRSDFRLPMVKDLATHWDFHSVILTLMD